MRHRVGHRKLGRTTSHRIALLRSQAAALLAHETIQTTVPKAKELRPFVERLITIAKRGVKAADPKGQSLSARRLVMRDLLDETVVTKLFDDLAPRFSDRPGGYTRILRVGHRRGDAAEIAQIELIGSEFDPKKAEAQKQAAEQEGGEQKTQKSVGERLKAAAQRLRGGKKAKGGGEGGSKAKASKPARGAAKQTSTPRKAGGS
jgi:large subunit ribosomal protein L17